MAYMIKNKISKNIYEIILINESYSILFLQRIMKNTFLASKIYGDKQGQSDMGDGKWKLLPHIIGEYEYRITNKILVHKILNPRRDKLIRDSLLNASNLSCSNDKSKIQPKTSYSFYRRRKNDAN